MKSIKSTAILILGSLFVAISFAACSAEDNIPEKAPQVPSSSYPISDVHVIEKGYLKALKQRTSQSESLAIADQVTSTCMHGLH